MRNRNLSLRKKIILTSIMGVLLFGVLLLAVWSFVVNTVIKKRYEQFSQEIVYQIGKRVDLQVGLCNANYAALTRNPLLRNYLADLKYNRESYNIVKYNIIRSVIQLVDLDDIEAIYIYPVDSPIINCFYTESLTYDATLTYESIQKNLTDQKIWIPNPLKPNQLSQYCEISQNQEVYGILQIMYKEDCFSRLLDPAANHLQGRFVIQNIAGQVLATSVTESLAQGDTLKNNAYRLEHAVEGENWVLVGTLHLNDITSQIRSTLLILLGIFLLVIFANTFYSLLMLRYIRYPLKKIMFGMTRVQEGDLDVILEKDVDPEFSFMIDGFNQMTQRVKEQMETIYYQEVGYRKAELSALHSKLDAHFLYNVLDLLYWRFILKDDENSSEIVVALADILRYSISHGEEFVTIDEDRRQIESYLKIQQTLLNQRLHYQLHIDPTILESKIPKLLFQPVIENAMKHGFFEKEGDLNIVLQIEREDPFIRVKVIDNGVGMNQARLNSLLVSMKEESVLRKEGLGITMIYRRIKSIYGEKGGMEITSVEGMGTTVLLTFQNLEL